MKIRINFVSNSSSSSCVVCLPDNLKFEDLQIIDDDGSSLAMFEKLKSGKAVGEYDEGSLGFMMEILDGYIVATIDGGPDDAQIIPVNKSRIKEIMKNE